MFALAEFCYVRSFEPQIRALALHLDVPLETIESSNYGLYGEGQNYECSEALGEYAVLTDDEADRAFSEAIDSYIETARHYFDREAFARDCRISDGRGHTLSSYDGAENKECIDGVWYYIYRTN